MKLSYEGIGQWAATFACDDLAEGELVKVSANGTVAACAAGDGFLRHGAFCRPGRRRLRRGPGRHGRPPGTPYRQKRAAPALGWSGL